MSQPEHKILRILLPQLFRQGVRLDHVRIAVGILRPGHNDLGTAARKGQITVFQADNTAGIQQLPQRGQHALHPLVVAVYPVYGRAARNALQQAPGGGQLALVFYEITGQGDQIRLLFPHQRGKAAVVPAKG